MGVPKFYRWISERYPCLSEVVKEFQLPEFDNLYLDMNGVVHVCSHPEDDNPHFRITEEQIFKDICHYIEFLFRMIKPRKVFFMAIDGVAPRAKMNQQRGRRFRSAREAEELIKKALEKGEELPTEKRFDSNCITPGTPFMKRLQDHLKYFVVTKVSSDPLWQGPKIILSGHETPGEGEHKVMDFIRYSRSQPGHDPNTRHCLYGLDADLIMLGLTSHEPHFALLREEVRFGGRKDRNKRPTTPEETTFHLLHLSLMREYLDYEFSSLKTTLPFDYNLENVIDDWILMGFLVGNDFIPHLPHLHIHHDALPLLWKTYIQVLPSLDGYLNEGGHLNLVRFEKYINALAQFDRDQFSDQFMDMKYLEGKRGPQGAFCVKKTTASTMATQQKAKGSVGSAFALLEGLDNMDADYGQDSSNGQLEAHLASEGLHMADVDSDEDFDTFDAEFSAHKRDYYMTKMEYETVTPEVLHEQATGYVRAIQWILLYYYEGVQSWSWYYPHHYAPYISDVRNFSNTKITFDMSEPFKPFEQLMAVLPAASKELLPAPLQDLMTNPASPILDYYPVNFKTDLNGKQQDWEAVVLIPFIDERRLLQAMRTREHMLTAEERYRNTHGPCYQYQHSIEHQGLYPSPMPAAFPDIAASHAKICDIPKFHFCLEPRKIRKGLLPETRLDVYFPGFPTLKNIPHEHCLEKSGVKVFQMNSRGFNMMLKIISPAQRSLEDIAGELLGQVTWVGWPHLHEAKVYAVADERFKIEIEEQHKKGQRTPVVQWKRRELSKAELEMVFREATDIKEKYHDRFGVVVGRTTVLVYAGHLTGIKYVHTSQGRISTEKQFSASRIPFALQATSKDVLAQAPDSIAFQSMEDLFPKEAPVFMLGNPNYGCQGEVLEVEGTEGRVRVLFSILQEPDLRAARERQQVEHLQYVPGHVASQRLGLHSHLMARMTGTVLIMRGDGGNPESKANIGLNLKFTKRGEEVPGYTKKTDNGWLYSEKCLHIINDYLREFADVWDYIATSQTGNSDIYTEAELFPEGCDKTLKDMLKFLEELPCSKVTPMKVGADIVGESTVQAIEQAVDSNAETARRQGKKVRMLVKSHLLFRPLPNQGNLEPDPGAGFEMLDRVVVVKMGYSVPFGLRGTIIGIYPAPRPSDTLYDVVFDKTFVGGILLRCSTKRCYRVPAMAMLNLTYGETRKGLPAPPAQQPSPRQQAEQPLPGAFPQAWGQQVNRGGQGQRGVGSSQGQGHGSYSALMRKEGRGQESGAYSMSSPGQLQGQWPKVNHQASSANSKPQFVTPRLATSPPKPARGASKGPSGAATTAADNSVFTNIWNQLQQSNTAPAPSGPSANNAGSRGWPGGAAKEAGAGLNSPIFGGGSQLLSAAQKLAKIAPPPAPLVAGDDEDSEPPTGILVDLSESGTSVTQATSGNLVTLEMSGSLGTSAQVASMPQAGPSVGMATHSEPSLPSKSVKHEASSKSKSKNESNENAASVLALFERANQAQAETDLGKSPPEGKSGGRLQALFEHAQRVKAASADPAASSSEFNALFAALQVAPKSTSPGITQETTSHPSTEDGSLALKQMLKIGMEEDTPSAEPSSRKSYGRQVSVQELFDVAKQAPMSSQVSSQVDAASTPSQPPARQTAPPAQVGHQGQHKQPSQQLPPQQLLQQPQQRLPHPLLLPPQSGPRQQPPNAGQTRNPVEELAALCQASGQSLPKYDLKLQHSKQKGFICLVTLPGGARFEGSLSPSRDEAAESAASMAMLCLKQAQGLMQGLPWLQRPGAGLGPPQRLFSPNSAFSPVANPLMRFPPAMFAQPPAGLHLPPGQGRQPLLTQPPPRLLPGRAPHPHLFPTQPPPPARPPFSQASQRPANQNLAAYKPANQRSSPSAQGGLPAANHSTPSKEPASQESEKGNEAAGSGKSSTEAFIPMQVTRKHRRKEDTPEKQPTSARSTDSSHSAESSSATSQPGSAVSTFSPRPTGDHDNRSRQDASGVAVDSVHSGGGGGSLASASAKPTPKSPAGLEGEGKKSEVTAQGSSQGSSGSGKKRRPRIAANFNFN